MAKSSKERQREYRARHRQEQVQRRLDLWVSSQAYSALERLADRFKIAKREILEQLVLILDADISAHPALDDPHWRAVTSDGVTR
jgi:hypothetical protein